MVLDELRRMIYSGQLLPGARLRQAKIAEVFGVSTTPVREAFSALALEGLVRQDAHRGAVVFELQLEDLNENYEMREVLEPLAASFAVEYLDDATLLLLDRIVRQMRSAGTVSSYHALNRDFHATIYRAAGRPRLLAIIESLRDASEVYYLRFNAQTTLEDPHVQQVHKEHEAIAEALRAADGDEVGRLLKDHLARNRRKLAEFISTLPAADGSTAA